MNDFSKGDRVRYKKTGERGVISSQNEYFVFVKYDNKECIMVTGDEPYTSQATVRSDLVKVQTDG